MTAVLVVLPPFDVVVAKPLSDRVDLGWVVDGLGTVLDTGLVGVCGLTVGLVTDLLEVFTVGFAVLLGAVAALFAVLDGFILLEKIL